MAWATIPIALLSYGVLDGTDEKMMAASSLIIALYAIVFVDSNAATTGSLCLNFFLFSTLGSQVAFLLVGANGLTEMMGVGPSLAAKPVARLYYDLAYLGVMAAVAALFAKARLDRHGRSFEVQVNEDRRCAEIALAWCLPLSAMWTVVAYLPSSVGWVVKTFGAHVEFIPFFAGRYLSPKNRTFWAWVALLIINAAVSLLVGGRYNAFFPLLVFSIGICTALPPAARRVAFLVALIGIIPGLGLVGAFGVVRSVVGRDDASLVSLSHASTVLSELESVRKDQSDQMKIGLLRDGAVRLIPWANYAVPSMSPEVVPFRGYETFASEVANAFAIYRFSPGARERMVFLQMGGLAATNYGFAVGEGFAVEWGVLADGWSRSGWLGGVLFLGIGALFLLGSEMLLARTELIRPGLKVLLYPVIIGAAVRMNSVAFLETLRTASLAIVLYGLVLLFVQSFLNRFLPARVAPGPERPGRSLPTNRRPALRR